MRILVASGYVQGSNCIQLIEDLLPSGESSVALELHGGKCVSFAIAGAPIATFELEYASSSSSLSFLRLAGERVGYFDADAGAIGALCLGRFARACHLQISRNGVIEAVTLTGERPDDRPEKPQPGSPEAKQILEFTNNCLMEETRCWKRMFADDALPALWKRLFPEIRGELGKRIGYNPFVGDSVPARYFRSFDELLEIPESEYRRVIRIGREFGAFTIEPTYGLSSVENATDL